MRMAHQSLNESMRGDGTRIVRTLPVADAFLHIHSITLGHLAGWEAFQLLTYGPVV
ncbi:hypothetical protein CHELA1G11_10039 [Hyphomicrobiales bacterium]|nr:hypothetical protein CHELA1G11_10039 [Hyphomicrobiales bacterium]